MIKNESAESSTLKNIRDCRKNWKYRETIFMGALRWFQTLGWLAPSIRDAWHGSHAPRQLFHPSSEASTFFLPRRPLALFLIGRRCSRESKLSSTRNANTLVTVRHFVILFERERREEKERQRNGRYFHVNVSR
ncbi:hypothetical protein PUN28_015489 [Cardiocondyla obscurior]|uniref:Uncharacterized protein n=1 Tax=Cardiocondyla obscurior TaxID=286306 RepID=A0AAW2EYK2_9HYME